MKKPETNLGYCLDGPTGLRCPILKKIRCGGVYRYVIGIPNPRTGITVETWREARQIIIERTEQDV